MGSSVGSPAAYLGNYLTKTNTSFSQAIWPKDLIEKAGYLVLEPSKSTPPHPPPRIPATKQNIQSYFLSSQKITKAMISCWTTFPYWIPFSLNIFLSKLSLSLLLWAPSPEHWDQLFSKANPAFPPRDFAASVTSVWRVRTFEEFLFGRTWRKQMLLWQDPSQCWGCRAPNLPREPRRVLGLASSQSSPCLKASGVF